MTQDTVITQKRRGPAPTGKGVLVGVRLQPGELARLDAMRGSRTRPEAIRDVLSATEGGEGLGERIVQAIAAHFESRPDWREEMDAPADLSARDAAMMAFKPVAVEAERITRMQFPEDIGSASIALISQIIPNKVSDKLS